MADIKQFLDNIKNALFGREVRSSIHDGIEAINKEVEGTTAKQEHLETTFNQLIINAGNSNAEIVAARIEEDGTQHATLGDRLNLIQTTINNHIAIPHVTYRETTPIRQMNVLVTDKNEAILTDNDDSIILTGITKNNKEVNTITNGVKIIDLPQITPSNSDLIVIESQSGTSSSKVSELLKPINIEINTIKNESIKYSQI